MNTLDLKIGGMHCGSCAMLVQTAVEELPGVSKAAVDKGRETAHVEFDPAVVSISRIITIIEEAGYTAARASA